MKREEYWALEGEIFMHISYGSDEKCRSTVESLLGNRRAFDAQLMLLQRNLDLAATVCTPRLSDDLQVQKLDNLFLHAFCLH